MTALAPIPVCILAGGGAKRFGAQKALATLAGKPLIQHVIDRLAVQTEGPVLISANAAPEFAGMGCPVIADIMVPDLGPLAGVHSALSWAHAHDHETIITVAADCPFLPSDLVPKLLAAKAASIAASAGRWHPVTGCWPATLRAKLYSYLESGSRSAHGWAEHCHASVIDFAIPHTGIAPFYNINTHAQLQEAEAMLRSPR